MIWTKSLIVCVWIGLLLLLPACRTNTRTDVEKDTAAAIDMLSKTPEADVSGVLKAVELIQRHPQKEALAALIPHLDDPKPTRRRSAVHLIQTVHWDDGGPALPALRQLLVNPEALTRGMSGMALASLRDDQCFESLVRMLEKDDDPYARRCAAWALGELTNQMAMGHLEQALNDSNELVKSNAENALERLNFWQESRGVTGPATAVYEGVWLISGSSIRMETRIRRAVEMIRSVEEPIRRPILEDLKAHKLASVRNSALVALGRI